MEYFHDDYGLDVETSLRELKDEFGENFTKINQNDIHDDKASDIKDIASTSPNLDATIEK